MSVALNLFTKENALLVSHDSTSFYNYALTVLSLTILSAIDTFSDSGGGTAEGEGGGYS